MMNKVCTVLFAIGMAALLMAPSAKADAVHQIDFADVNGGGITVWAANTLADSQLLIGNGGSIATISGIGVQSITLPGGITSFALTGVGGNAIDTSVSVRNFSGFSGIDIFSGSSLVARAWVASSPDSVVPTPEPASVLLLVGSLAVGLGFIRHKQVKES